MMNKIFSIIILLISISSFSQKIRSKEFSGIITLSNGNPLVFELELKEKNGIVNGFSITGKGTIDETLSEIRGIYNKNTKTYKIKETKILSTSSEEDLNNFCYINMQISEIGKLSLKRHEGTFTGYFTNGEKCEDGKVILIEKEKLENKIEKVKKKIKKQKKEIEIIPTKVLMDGESMNINWNSDKIIIFIWDSNQEDGDMINLTINGEVLLSNFTTVNKRKKKKYKLQKGENIIELTAINLGKIPPNTSTIELHDGKIKYPVIAKLEINKTAIIRIIL